jgi:hypothetical protein
LFDQRADQCGNSPPGKVEMAVDFLFRQRAVRSLTASIGVYVGQSTDGIRSRVARHLTSARSDIIANRQIDVWEIAFVWAFPVKTREEITPLEARLFVHYNAVSQLMNGAMMRHEDDGSPLPTPSQVVQVMSDPEIAERKDPSQRLPRQAEHYAQIVGHFLAVKNSPQIARAMNAHFQRLQKYHTTLLGIAEEVPGDAAEE